MAAPHLHLNADAIYPFDARAIAKRFRHAAIFGALDALRSRRPVALWIVTHHPDALRGRTTRVASLADGALDLSETS